ncbi:LacI family DNA-binding transcriptional regulator [Pseudoclostridium thermosuccinogenes]|uniref:LacI family DNA-binding transcriptional regulator n=1 Tax=Clostridium thermosuccinogenes TaxID=84032 RepID=UPI002FDB7567
MGITIKDIAQAAGVGISTVSRVINNSGPVSEKTRKKVMSAISEHNFIPNNSARNLKISQSKNIALMVKGITNPFFNKMIRIIEREVALRGYPLLIQNVDYSVNEMDVAIQEAQDRNLCGVIMMGGSFTYTEERFRQLNIPCVLLTVKADKSVDPSLYSSVCIDDEKEGYRATEYLISLGHKRIGFIHHSPSDIPTPSSLRYKGYLRALEEHGIAFDPSLVASNPAADASGFDVGFQLMKQLHARNRDMTAVFAHADILAIGAAKAAFVLGLDVPNDISIVGFDGIEMAEYYHPSIDTIHQPAQQMALSCIETLFDMIQGGKSQHMTYNCVLLKRGSCKNINTV